MSNEGKAGPIVSRIMARMAELDRLPVKLDDSFNDSCMAYLRDHAASIAGPDAVFTERAHFLRRAHGIQPGEYLPPAMVRDAEAAYLRARFAGQHGRTVSK